MRLPAGRPPHAGWCGDHPYGQPMIESYTSAHVLQCALTLTSLIEEANHQVTLTSFTVQDPRREPSPQWMAWETYRIQNEPDTSRPILAYIHENMVQPILEDHRQLPSSDRRSVSAVLFGPPGTSKTTIVRAVASGLKWPVVMLSPGSFIQSGLDSIEAQAEAVFRRLQALQRAVVLFDECDELFRKRDPTPHTEQTRGIAAFVTASMLPKLQQLHDRGRVVFFICTNKVESLDPAVTRPGRFDHLIGVGPPDEGARRRIISTLVPPPGPAYWQDTIDALVKSTERFVYSDLKLAVHELLRSEPTSTDEARGAVKIVVDRLAPSLAITADDMKSFIAEQSSHSYPFTRGGGINASP